MRRSVGEFFGFVLPEGEVRRGRVRLWSCDCATASTTSSAVRALTTPQHRVDARAPRSSGRASSLTKAAVAAPRAVAGRGIDEAPRARGQRRGELAVEQPGNQAMRARANRSWSVVEVARARSRGGLRTERQSRATEAPASVRPAAFLQHSLNRSGPRSARSSTRAGSAVSARTAAEAFDAVARSRRCQPHASSPDAPSPNREKRLSETERPILASGLSTR
jgi:hypothetical protein